MQSRVQNFIAISNLNSTAAHTSFLPELILKRADLRVAQARRVPIERGRQIVGKQCEWMMLTNALREFSGLYDHVEYRAFVNATKKYRGVRACCSQAYLGKHWVLGLHPKQVTVRRERNTTRDAKLESSEDSPVP
jgi:hypothetical protein